ncbi:MAG: cytochrome c [Acidimicrobiales bacterium]|nr:cytochrome c [Acidimicrobiales bacterium]
MLLAASTQRTVGFAILALVFIGGVVYLLFNIRAAKAEVGSEIELAANRSVALKDEDLEGRRLDLALSANLIMLTIIAIALPFYWLGEPGRQEGRDVDTDRIFTNRGEGIYNEDAECVQCHGAAGAGGAVTTSITNDSGEFVAQVVWKAPALNTVLSRFSEDEILHTLNFGRNGVMPAWGGGGGGPLTDQQLDEIVYYLRSIQLDSDAIAEEVEGGVLVRVQEHLIEGVDEAGEFVHESDMLTAIREAQARKLAADLAEEEDVYLDCTDYPAAPGVDDEPSDDRAAFEAEESDEELAVLAICDEQAAANSALLELMEASQEALDDQSAEWLADAKAVKATAEMLAIDADPSLADEISIDAASGEEVNLPLRWAALELLAADDSDLANIDMYRLYGEFLFTNPAASGTYACARCHTFGWSYDAAERFTIRANGTTESILEEGYVQGDGFFGERLTGESTTNQFESARSHAQFIETGQTIGQTFGRAGGGGNGQMPGWAARTETDATGPTIGNDDEFNYSALLTADQIDAIVAFERTIQ